MNIERRAYIQKLVLLNFNHAGLHRIVVDGGYWTIFGKRAMIGVLDCSKKYLDGRLLGSTSGREGWLYTPHPPPHEQSNSQHKTYDTGYIRPLSFP
jgi:hypothetical protein